MYTKQERSKNREEFWTTFGLYMKPIPSAFGNKVNWVNYKTGIQGITFKMDANETQANIAVVFAHPDSDKCLAQYLLWHQFKSAFHIAMSEDWIWEEGSSTASQRLTLSISKSLPFVNVNNRNHWPEIIAYFKQRITALDEFWCSIKPGFED